MATRSTTAPSQPSRRRLRSLQQRCSGWIDRARYLLEEALRTAPADDAGYDAAALEDRILLSATPIVQAVAEGGLESGVDVPLTFAPEVQTAVAERRELVVIDSAAANYQQLVDDLGTQPDRQLDVIVLDAQRDGVEQISEWLSEHDDVDAIHIVSHAEDGAVRLGSGWLSDVNLTEYSTQLTHWGDSLQAGADLLLYGCDLAASEPGRELLESLQALTGADVAASVDATGHAQYGGNWELEYEFGDIQTTVAFSSEMQQSWYGKLATITVSTSSDINDGDTSSIANLLANKGSDGAISLREAILAANAGAGGDTIQLSADTYTLAIAGADDTASFGDLDILKEITIIGDGANTTIIDGGGIDRVFEVRSAGGALTLNDLTVRGGNTSSDGGGIHVQSDTGSLTLNRVTISDNIANFGAGIANNGVLNLTDVVMSSNGNASTIRGGGLNNAGNATLNRVTIYNNAADSGGGIYHTNDSTGLSLTNVTVSANTATSGGGGLYVRNSATIVNSTFTLNQASSGGGIRNTNGSHTIDISNSIVANNSVSSANPDVQGTLNSQGYNLIEDTTGGDGIVASDLTGVSANLSALGNYGGLTPTHALLNGSAAIDAGTSASAASIDQRGQIRDATPDIGAFEYRYALTNTDELRVNSTTGNTQETSQEGRGSQQAVAMAAEGDYVVVWSSSNQDGLGWGVYAQLYNKDGAARGSELLINSGDTDYDQKWATVGMDAAGNFVVAWTDFNLLGDSDIYARRFDADGSALGGIFQVNDASLYDRSNPSIAVADDGRFVIAWQGGSGLTDEDIFARRFDASGAALDGSDIVVEGAAGGDYDAAVTINNSGQFAVLWDDAGGVKVQRFSADGSTNGGQITVDGSGNAGNGSLAMHDDGSLVVTWREGATGSRDVRVRRYDNTGSAEGPATNVSTSIAGDQTDPSISMDIDGNYVIVWEGAGDQAGHSDTSGVFGQKYDAAGTKVGDEFRINQSTSGTQHLTSAAMLNIDNFVAVWSGNGDQASQTDSSGVFVRQYGTQIVNHFPTADAGGAYTIDEGQGLVLSAAASSDPDGDTLTYKWDLDNDGQFGEVGEPTGVGATVDWATLQSFGIDDHGGYTIGVRVDDGKGGIHSATTTLTVNGTAPVLNVGGAATGTEDAVFSLTLSATDPGDDTVTQWTVDWGDGTTTTHNFDAGTATHTYTVGGNFNILVAASDEDGTYVQRELLVAANKGGNDDVYRFDAATGQLVSTLASSGGDLRKPIQALVGPNGDIYVTGFDSDNVVRYDSAGNYLGEFVSDGSGGLDQPSGMAFDADGNLYVASFKTDQILRYDASGNFVDVFGSDGADMDGPTGLAFGPDGDLYVSSRNNSKLFKYDGTDGGSPTIVIGSGLFGPDQLVFNSDGDLLIANGTDNDVKIYDGSLSTFASGMDNATGIALSPEGILYVANRDSDSITMFDATSGASLGTLVASGTGGLEDPYHINWIPDHQVQIAHVADTPTVTDSTTNQETQTTTGLVISRNSADTASVTHYKISNIADGVLYLNDGSTQINNGDFITVAEGAAGLKFTPDSGFSGTASFDVQASLAGNDGGLGGGIATANVTVNAAANTAPSVSLDNVVSPINENTSTAGGLKVADIAIIDDGNGANTLGLSGADAAAFEIDGLELKFKSSLTLDYEAKSSYDVTVTVDDASIPGSPDDSASITILLQDVNEFNLSVISDADGAANAVDENVVAGTVVGITAAAVDADLTNNTVSYTLINDAQGRFTINATTGVVTVSGALDAEDDNEHTVVVRAFSSDGSFKTKAFQIDVNDVNESAIGAIVDADGAANTVNENVATGTAVGITAAAVDADVTAVVSYSLDDDAGGRFTINSSTGIVTVAAALDAETATAHNIVVRATSSDTSTSTKSFTINVGNVNDNLPVFSSSDTVSIAENLTIVQTLSATDADVPAQTISFTLSGGDDASLFTINGSNQLVFLVAPDYEAPSDFNADNVYQVEVTADDGAGGTTSQNIAVTVTDGNEAPSITAVPNQTLNEDQSGGPWTFTIGDLETPAAGLSVTASSSNPAVIRNSGITLGGSGANRTITVTPVANQSGTSVITMTVSDGTLTTDTSFVVTVNSVNDAAVGRNDRILVLDDSVTFTAADLMANDYDVEGDAMTLQIVSPPEHGTLIDLGGGRFAYQPDENGDTFMTYRLFDGTDYSDPVTVRFSVPRVPVTPPALPPTYDAPVETSSEPSEPSEEATADEPQEETTEEESTVSEVPVVPNAPPQTVRPAPIDVAAGLPAGLQNGSQGFTWTLRSDSLVEAVVEVTERVLGEGAGSDNREEIKAAYATAAAQIRDAITQPQMWQAIHSMQEQIDSSVSTTTLTIGATVTATTSITVGYVVWVIRGGILLSSVMANLPMWRLMDPMAILNAVDGAEEDDESLESMVDEQPPTEPVGADA